MKTAGHASPAEFFTALKFQNSAVAFPEENHSHEGCVAGTTFVPAKGTLSGELGKARRDRDAWTAWKQNCTAKHASSFFAHSLMATPYHLLPLWAGTSSRDSAKKRQGRFRDACPNAHCDTQKTPRRKAGRFASRNQHRGRISSSSRTGGRFSNRILSRLATQRAAISSKPF